MSMQKDLLFLFYILAFTKARGKGSSKEGKGIGLDLCSNTTHNYLGKATSATICRVASLQRGSVCVCTHTQTQERPSLALEEAQGWYVAVHNQITFFDTMRAPETSEVHW